jgi:hypothetical protein
MPQESTTVQWDPIYIHREPSAGSNIYVLFLLVACAAAVFNLARVWRAVLPFSAKQPVVVSSYLKLLQLSSSRLRRWIGLIFLSSGLLTSTTVYNTCNGLLMEKGTRMAAILPVIQDFSAALSVGLLVAVFLYLVRWYLLSRLERFRD